MTTVCIKKIIRINKEMLDTTRLSSPKSGFRMLDGMSILKMKKEMKNQASSIPDKSGFPLRYNKYQVSVPDG